MMIISKNCSPKTQRTVFRGMSAIAFVMLIISTLTPLLLWYRFQEGYLLRGLWNFCDRNGCNELFDPGTFLDAAQALSIVADISGLIALLSMWEVLNCITDWNVNLDENFTSSVANFITGIFLFCTLLITFIKLRTIVDIHGNRLIPFCGFYFGCLACILSFILGVYSLQQCKNTDFEEQKLNREITLEEIGADDSPSCSNLAM
ncbi:uncharacterized protein LOC121915989 [Sceloporus undulatus]|uniref:uncharacterized protein LOC121915989 n=1 Tax=Sceloporus undulatus TaxID=8520 RepID=UPI001C4A9EC8|nr:uncharacterized protein LOC121915989 [Sceloporus undulatus]